MVLVLCRIPPTLIENEKINRGLSILKRQSVDVQSGTNIRAVVEIKIVFSRYSGHIHDGSVEMSREPVGK